MDYSDSTGDGEVWIVWRHEEELTEVVYRGVY